MQTFIYNLDINNFNLKVDQTLDIMTFLYIFQFNFLLKLLLLELAVYIWLVTNQ